jgi:uncharacterized protein (DUF2235 family)
MAKNIIVCCDGTGNEYGKKNTNVVKFFEAIEKDSAKQVAYYDPGVGTFSAPAAFTKTQKLFSKLLGLAFGYGITKNIEDAYEYLMDKYEEDDYVYLFGFSRGAFTARALAGMLHKCGLLVKGSNNLIPYATRMYRFGEDSVARGFKKTFSRMCRPHFVGVWDTVKSIGLIKPRRFPNAKLNPDVNIGIHALSIDEKRSKFRPNLWEVAKISEDVDQFIRQVWFAGVHSDIGGSYKEAGLSNITLKWMLDEARSQGLLIKEEVYKKIIPCYKDKIHNSLLPFWWILGWKKRKIEIGSLIHKSVYDRMEDVKSYKPKNVPSKECVTVWE